MSPALFFVAPVASARPAPPPGIQVARTLGGAVALLKKGHRAVVVPNAFPALTRAPKREWESRDLDMDDEESVRRSVRQIPGVEEALCELAGAHADVTGRRVRGRVAVVSGTPCPRFHVDKVQLRGFCALYGPGCVVAGDGMVDLGAGGAGDVGVREFERAVVKDKSGLLFTETGDAMFLVGDVDGDAERGMVHRSPWRNKWWEGVRVIVQTDCWE